MVIKLHTGDGFYIFDDVGHGGPLVLEEVWDEMQPGDEAAERGTDAWRRENDPREACRVNGHLKVAGVPMNYCGHCGERIGTMSVYSTSRTPFMKVIDEITALHLKKQADYGSDADPFANVRASSDFGVASWVGCMIRANDKMKRIQKAAKGGVLVNESLEDSLMDLAVYSIIGLVLAREDATKA